VNERLASMAAMTDAPSWHHQARFSSVIDPYQAYCSSGGKKGCRKGSVLFRELKAQGYQGIRTCGLSLSHASYEPNPPHKMQRPGTSPFEQADDMAACEASQQR